MPDWRLRGPPCLPARLRRLSGFCSLRLQCCPGADHQQIGGAESAGERQLTYESNMEPIGGAWIQFNIRYYMFALVFVIFDVETVFLYPWAVAFNRLGLLAFIEALIDAFGGLGLRLAQRRS